MTNRKLKVVIGMEDIKGEWIPFNPTGSLSCEAGIFEQGQVFDVDEDKYKDLVDRLLSLRPVAVIEAKDEDMIVTGVNKPENKVKEYNKFVKGIKTTASPLKSSNVAAFV